MEVHRLWVPAVRESTGTHQRCYWKGNRISQPHWTRPGHRRIWAPSPSVQIRAASQPCFPYHTEAFPGPILWTLGWIYIWRPAGYTAGKEGQPVQGYSQSDWRCGARQDTTERYVIKDLESFHTFTVKFGVWKIRSCLNVGVATLLVKVERTRMMFLMW